MSTSNPTPSTPSTPSPPSPAPQPSLLSHLTSSRSRRQLSLFVAGASFFALSSLITRRSLLRKRALVKPTFYYPSNAPPKIPVNGALEAFEALNIATINVASFTMMMTGGVLWACDISTLEELRKEVRGGLGVDGTGRGESDAEDDWEEWLAGVVERKREKEKRRRRERAEKGIVESVDDRRIWEEDIDVSAGERVNEKGKKR
ncbi:hypothetical protein MMC30_002789 [Trapelia coarctata]|nr:hypothetical protein [Trapelia coarctata]